jgi:hypothetical protein
MVLEHQVKVHNLITLTNYNARMALHYEEAINKALNRPADYLSDSTRSRFQSPADKLIRYLLFIDEAPLAEPITGTSTFAEEFAARGPRDRQGRSLRDFDFTRRMFKYPCSYEIYSASFAALPDVARDYIFRTLHEILTGQNPSPDFARLTTSDRQAILEILHDTMPSLPSY